MARKHSFMSGITGVFALLAMMVLFTPAQAYTIFCEEPSNAGDGDGGLPCLDYGNDGESSVEAALAHVYGYSIDVMQIAKVDVPDPWNGSRKYSSDGKLRVESDWVYDGDAYAGEWKYTGPEEIAFITIKAGNRYVIYNAADLISSQTDSYVKGHWSTYLISDSYGRWKGLSHLSIWKVVGSTQVPEPAPLALLLVGAGYLAWRRRRPAEA